MDNKLMSMSKSMDVDVIDEDKAAAGLQSQRGSLVRVFLDALDRAEPSVADAFLEDITSLVNTLMDCDATTRRALQTGTRYLNRPELYKLASLDGSQFRHWLDDSSCSSSRVTGTGGDDGPRGVVCALQYDMMRKLGIRQYVDPELVHTTETRVAPVATQLCSSIASIMRLRLHP